MSVLSQPTPQISVGPPPTLTYQVSVTNGQAYTLTVFQTLNGTNTVVVSPTSYTGTGSLQTYTFTSPVTSYSYYTSVLIGVTTTNSPSVLYYSPYQGPQGVQGNPGTVGGQGPIGPVGPQGPQGLQGVVSVTNYVTCNSLITSGTSSGTVNAHSTAVLTPAGALSGITTISLPSVAAAAAVSTIYKAASSPDNTITSWGDGSGWRFNFLGNAARTSNVLTLVDNGNVGINCNAPAYTLDVAGNSRILCNANTSTSSFGTTNETLSLMSPCNGYTGGVASIYFGNATANYPLARIYAQDASTGGNYRSRLVFQTNADSSYMAERMRIEAGGNVGINCTPSYQLDVKGSINAFASGSAFSTSILLTATGATANPATSRTLLGSIQMGGQGYGPWLNAYQKNTSYADGVDFSICTNAAGNTQTITERLTVLGGANAGGATRVGIGCNAPSYTLDVTGTINTASQFVANVDATNTNPLSLANNAASGSLLQILQTGTAGGWLNNCVAGDTSIRSFGKLLLAAGSTSGTGILNASIILGNSNYCVGIGSNVNPSSTLDVVGTTRLTTASSLASTAPDGGANHGLMLVSTKAPDSGKTAYSMALGVDSGTGYGYINAAGNTALQPILLQSRGGGVGIGLTTAPNYSLDVYGGSANFSFNGTYGTVFVGSSDGLLIQGYSSGASYIRADCNAANGISTNALFLGTGGCNVVDITRTDVQCHPTNALYVRNDKGAGNFVVEGTSYLNNISNTNLYATSAIVSGTTAGRLVMVGTQDACYIEAGLNSDTGSAAPLYFTDMNNANQWMCIGSTGNVGINNNSPVGRFHVKTSGNALDTFLGWDSTWMVVTPAANAATAKNTPGLGLGYSVASNTAYVTALAPNDKWKNLNLDGSNINLSPHDGGVNVNGSLSVFGGSHYIRGLTQVVADGGSVVATTPSGAATYPTNAFCVKAQTRLPDTTYSISNVFSVTTYVYSTSYTSNSIFMAINPTHYMIVTAWQDNGNWFSGSLLYTHLGGYSNAGSFVGNLSIGGAGAGIKFTNMTSGSGFRCTMIAVSAGMS